MTQLLLDENTNDIAIINNRFSFTENNSDIEIAQRLKQELRFFLGEWFLDVTKGIPWIQVIFKKGTTPDIIENILKDKIVSTKGVTMLRRFEPLDLNTKERELNVSFEVLTVNNTTLTINEVI